MGEIRNFFKKNFYSKFEQENHFKLFKNVILFFPIFKLFFRVRNTSLLKIFEFTKTLILFKMITKKSFRFYEKKKPKKKKNKSLIYFPELSQKIFRSFQEVSIYSSPVFLGKKSAIGLYPIGSLFFKEYQVNTSSLEIGRKKFKTKIPKKNGINIDRSDKKKQFSIIFKKKNLKDTFFFGTSEFSQLKGWFNSTGGRTKTFSMIWNQSLWIENQFYYQKKKIEKIKEEVFLLNLLTQANQLDFCPICYFQKDFTDNFTKAKIHTYLNWKTLKFEKKWSQLYSSKKKNCLFLIHKGYSADFAADNIVYKKKKKSEFKKKNFFSLKFFLLYELPFRKVGIVITPSDFSLPFFYQKKIKIKTFLKKKQSIQLKGEIFKVKKNCFDYNFWNFKCNDSFFPNFSNRLFLILFLMSNKLKKEKMLKRIIQFLFFRSVQLWPFKVEFSDFSESKLIKNYQNFLGLMKYKNSKFPVCCFEFHQSTDGVFFSKKTFLKYFQILNREVLQHLSNFERLNLTISVNHMFSIFFLQIFKMKINSETVEFQIDKLILEFENLAKCHNKNPFFEQNPATFLKTHGICIVHILDQKKKKNSPVKFSFSIGTFYDSKEKQHFEIWIRSEKFFQTLSLICAKFKTKIIFVKGSQEIREEVISGFKLDLSKQSKISPKKPFLLDKKSLKKVFFSNLQIVSLEENSVGVLLSQTPFGKKRSQNKRKNLTSTILKIIRGATEILTWLFSSEKNRKSYDVFFKNLNLSSGAFREILNFNLRRIFSEFKINLSSIFSKKKKLKPLFGLLCGLGWRKGRKIGKKKTSKIFPEKNLLCENLGDILEKDLKYDTSPFEKPRSSLFNDFLKTSNDFKQEAFFFKHLTILGQRTECSFGKGNELKKSTNINEVTKIPGTPKKPFKATNITKNLISCPDRSTLSLKRNLNPETMWDLEKHKIFWKTNETREFKFFSRNWKNKLLESNPIGDITIIKDLKNKLAFFIKGKTDLGIQIFLERKNIFNFSAKFPFLIQESLKFFPAKIISVYPRIFFCRVSLIPGQFTTLSSFKSLKNSDNFILSSEKKAQFSKFSSYLESLKNYQRSEDQDNHIFFLPKKFGEIFFRKTDHSFLEISLVIDPMRKKYFSFFIGVQFDLVNQEWIFIYERTIFFQIHELVLKNIDPLKERIYNLINNKDFFPGTFENLKKIFTGTRKKIESYFFKFGFLENTSGKCFLFLGISKKKFLTSFFFIEKESYNFNGKKFSFFYPLKKFYLKLAEKKLKSSTKI